MAFKVFEVEGGGCSCDSFSVVAESEISDFAHSSACFEVGEDEELEGDVVIFY